MNTSKFLNTDKKAATIEIQTGIDLESGVPVYTRKTWAQLNDSEKQTLAGKWIKTEVYCNVNQVIELLMQNYDHCDYDEALQIAEYQNFEYVSNDHINDLSLDELTELIEEYDLDIVHTVLFKKFCLSDLVENTKNTCYNWQDLHDTLTSTLGLDLEKVTRYTIADLEKLLISELLECNYSYDDLDTVITELGINFDGYLKAFQSELSSIIIKQIDLDQYGQDNDLEPEYQHAYEFYSVSSHFANMIENCSDDILGLSVWGRFCTGQAIVLDHQIQVAAFKVLSDMDYKNY